MNKWIASPDEKNIGAIKTFHMQISVHFSISANAESKFFSENHLDIFTENVIFNRC